MTDRRSAARRFLSRLWEGATENMGLKAVEIAAGTGYHIAEGSFAVYAPQVGAEDGVALDQRRQLFPANHFKAWAHSVVMLERHDAKLLVG